VREAEPWLAGVTVLLTRPAGRGAALARALAACGARVEARPTIAFAPPSDPRPAARLRGALARYAWVVFTSPAGVRFFTALHGRLDRPGPSVAAIGAGTARELERHGMPAELIAADRRSEGLADELGGRIVAGQRVLVVRPQTARPVLAEALARRGARVDAVAFYRTVAAPGVATIAADVVAGRYAVVVFTSPSTLRRLLDAAGPAGRGALVEALARTRVVAIGPVTAHALRAAELPVHATASEPSDDGLARCITGLFRRAVPPERCDPSGVLPFAPTPIDGSAALTDSSTARSRTTPIHEAHLAAGARMVDFAGWRMPVQYSGVMAEHEAVRCRAGLFDVSHMGEAVVQGPGALDLLQHLTPNDVARLKPGRAHYTALTTPQGTIVDDLLIYRMDAGEFLLVLNAANTAKDLAWLAEHARRFDARVADVSAEWAQLALQGPRAGDCLEPLAGAAIRGLRSYGFDRIAVDGVRCIVSRTGYTGEDGFEIYAPAAAGARLWSAILAAGAPHGLIPAGLGARDTLRLEARLLLHGSDIDETTTVVEAGLGWIVRPAKGEFLGRDVLARELQQGAARRLVGFEIRGRGIGRHGHRVLRGGREVGRVTSGTHAPTLRRSIGLAYLPAELAVPGTEIEIDIRGRHEPALVVPTPFYKREG
jgi:aminomethyltransferase